MLELDVLKLVCQRLEEANIPYMLTGSFAANFYAVPRMTRDIDIVIELHKTDIQKIFHLFQNDFYIDTDAIKEAIDHQSIFNIIHNESVFKIDFIIRKDSSYRRTEFLRKVKINLDDRYVWIVSPEDLIISKLDWAKDSFSEMQIKDIRNILLSQKDLDKDYIAKWIDKLDLKQIYSKVNIDA